MKINIGAVEAHEKLTARLRVQPITESGYIDVGNVASYKNAESRDYKTHATAANGARFVDDEQVDLVHPMYEFVLDEHDEYNERLLSLARTVSDADQDAATDDTASFTSVIPGRDYRLPARPVTSVSVEVASVAKTEGTDYEVNLDTGWLTILTGGTIAEDDNVDVTFSNPARGFQQWTAREQFLFRGDVILDEFNQFSAEPLRSLAGPANLSITAFPDNSGDFGTYTCRLTFTGKPVVTKRHDSADLLPETAS